MPRQIEPEDLDISDDKAKSATDSIRETIATLESDINSIATTLFGTEEFAKTATVIAEIQVRVRKVVENHMSQQLARLNMPSRSDITALGEHLLTIDDRLRLIEEKLAAIAPSGATSKIKRPPRTKKPKPPTTEKS